jgi:rubredoxin
MAGAVTEPDRCPACGLVFDREEPPDLTGLLPKNHGRRAIGLYDVDGNDVYGWMCPNCDHEWRVG